MTYIKIMTFKSCFDARDGDTNLFETVNISICPFLNWQNMYGILVND